MFKFIHTADLHLDSPFVGVSAQSSSIAESLHSATFDAYEALIQLCVKNNVDFLIVAGDVYDGADRSLRAQLRFYEGLKTLHEHNIRSFVVHGNHDPLDGWSSSIKWPDSVHIFAGDKVETITVQKRGEKIASVSGISYPTQKETRNLSELFHAENPDLFQIAMLHCNCGGNIEHEPYAACKVGNLVNKNFDYWALGHIHTKCIQNTNPHIVYPGNIQGLNIREQGPRGCYFVTVTDDKNVRMEFCPLDVIRWFSKDIRIEGSIDELDSRISACIDEVREQADGRSAVCRINFIGRGRLYKDLIQGGVADLLEHSREKYSSGTPLVWIEKIDLHCGPALDIEQRRNGKDLLGELLRISDELRNNGNLREFLTPAWIDLHNHKYAEKTLSNLSDEELKSILNDAEYLCVDMLESD